MPTGTFRLPWPRFFCAFFLSCKANARVKPANAGHGPHFSIFMLFYILFVLCCSVYCLCVNVYYTPATGWLPNKHISYHIISYMTDKQITQYITNIGGYFKIQMKIFQLLMLQYTMYNDDGNNSNIINNYNFKFPSTIYIEQTF